MARAAAKRNRGAGNAARQVDAVQAKDKKRKAEKSLEDELFFNRLRGHAKWVFVLLAVVFGASFVFLGVGSGNAGLSDVFSNIFGGSSGPSIESLQKKVAETPRDLQAVANLAQALEADGRTDEAIAAYRTYLVSKPKDRDALGSLALLFQNQAAAAGAEVNAAIGALSSAASGTQFQPGTGVLGEALGSYADPIAKAATDRAQAAYQAALGRYQAANKDALSVYKQLADLDPNDPTPLLNYAQVAADAGELKTAITAYQAFVKRFPDDNLVANARQRIAELKKQQASSISIPTP